MHTQVSGSAKAPQKKAPLKATDAAMDAEERAVRARLHVAGPSMNVPCKAVVVGTIMRTESDNAWLRNTAICADDDQYLTDVCLLNGTRVTIEETLSAPCGTAFLRVKACRKPSGYIKSEYVKVVDAPMPGLEESQSGDEWDSEGTQPHHAPHPSYPSSNSHHQAYPSTNIHPRPQTNPNPTPPHPPTPAQKAISRPTYLNLSTTLTRSWSTARA